MQLERRKGRLANLSPGIGWKDQEDAHSNLRAKPGTCWLVGDSPRLLSMNPGPQHPKSPWNDYIVTPASIISVQPSPPLRLDCRVPWGQQGQKAYGPRGQKAEGQDFSVQVSSGPIGLLLLGPTSGGLTGRGPILG